MAQWSKSEDHSTHIHARWEGKQETPGSGWGARLAEWQALDSTEGPGLNT